MKNLLKRTLSGICFLAIVLAALLVSKYLFGVIVVIAMALMMREFYRMTMGNEYLFSQILAIFAGIILFALTFLYRGFAFPGRLVILAFIPIFVVMVNSLYLKDKTDFGKFANLYTGMIYISIPMTLMNFAVFGPGGQFDGRLLLCLFALIFASDIGAYLFGTALGQKYGGKLFPEISPKKSWVGFWGGLFCSLLISFVIWKAGLLRYPIVHCLVLSVVTHIAGVYGDLFESQWKRHYALKDSGKIMPGHGGILDRLDSSLFAVPAGVIYLVVLNVL